MITLYTYTDYCPYIRDQHTIIIVSKHTSYGYAPTGFKCSAQNNCPYISENKCPLFNRVENNPGLLNRSNP